MQGVPDVICRVRIGTSEPCSLVPHRPHDDRHLAERAAHDMVARADVQPAALPLALEDRVPWKVTVRRCAIEESFRRAHEVGEGHVAEALDERAVAWWSVGAAFRRRALGRLDEGVDRSTGSVVRKRDGEAGRGVSTALLDV